MAGRPQWARLRGSAGLMCPLTLTQVSEQQIIIKEIMVMINEIMVKR